MDTVCIFLILSPRSKPISHYCHLFLQNFLNESLKCIDKLFPVAAGQNGSGGGACVEGGGLPLTGGGDSAKMAATAAAVAALANAKNHNQGPAMRDVRYKFDRPPESKFLLRCPSACRVSFYQRAALRARGSRGPISPPSIAFRLQRHLKARETQQPM